MFPPYRSHSQLDLFWSIVVTSDHPLSGKIDLFGETPPARGRAGRLKTGGDQWFLRVQYSRVTSRNLQFFSKKKGERWAFSGSRGRINDDC